MIFMTNLVDTVIIFLILTNLMLLGSSRLRTCILVVAIQGILLGILAILLEDGSLGIHLILLSAAIFCLKGIIFPFLLIRTLRDLNVQHEVEPFVGYGTSLVLSPLVLVVCIWLGSQLSLPIGAASSLVVPVAFFTITCGLFLIVSRKKALTQVLGYLVLENGIYVFGASIATIQPVLVELGILLDAFVAVFVMGIAIYHINREFDHTDVDRLNKLKG
jgi:hydrogenase-4 component E